MRLRPHSAGSRLAGPLATLACLAALAFPPAAAAARLHPAVPAARGEAARIERWWTPARMRAAAPLGAANPLEASATASFAPVAEPTAPPNAVEGRVFVRQGRLDGYCSGTAIDSPSRRLVLTAGHCVNSGPGGFFSRPVWSRYAMFVPAYSDGVAPFGAFVARRNSVFALPHWVRVGNPNYDVGALLTSPNAEGQNVADVVGGVTIALDRNRHQQFQTFGYPSPSRLMQSCESPYVGDDASTYPLPGPPTMAIGCHWAPGASGGGWLIEEGTAIDGLTSYGHPRDRVHTFGPYFSGKTVGHLVAGM
jgi:V8-like Glu-specific endopeptidase